MKFIKKTIIFSTGLSVLPLVSAAPIATQSNFSEDGQTIVVTAPGIDAFVSEFSATVEIDGVRKVLRSSEGTPGKSLGKAVEKTPYGEAQIAVSTVDFPAEKLALDLRVGQVTGVSGVLIQPVLHNRSSHAIKLISLTSVDMPSSPGQAKLDLSDTPNDWTATAYAQSTNGGPPNYIGTLAELGSGLNIREYGSIYRKDGTGFLFAPVGEPIAYLQNQVTGTPDGKATLRINSEMSGITVDPGESRVGQQAVLLMEPPRQALARWSEWVAQTHGSRTAKGALAGWCSWYHLTKNIKESDVLGVVDAVKADPTRLRPQVIQIDDGYQDIDGKWDANEKFPKGMPYYAKRIAETGARPGLWMAMTMIGVKHPWLRDPANMEAVWSKKFKLESGFRPDESGWLDPTHPRAIEHITGRIRHAVESGFTYLKLDFNDIGNGGWHEKKKTSLQIMREHYTRMRKAAGEDTYILACMIEANRAVLGLVDAHRDSHDAHRGGVRSAINDALRNYQLNGRWFAIDNDIYYIAPDAGEVGNVQGGWNLHRTWLSMIRTQCSTSKEPMGRASWIP